MCIQRPSSWLGLGLTALAALAWAPPATAGIMPVSSSLSLEADANAGAGTVVNTGSQSQGTSVSPLNASATATAINGGASVVSTITGSASWVSPAAGSITLSNVGWTSANVTSGSADLFNGLDYSYTFTPDVAGTLTFNFNVTAGGSSTFGLNGFSFSFDGDSRFFLINTSGTFTEPLAAGTTYTLQLMNFANISGSFGTRNSDMTGTFSFSIPEAPPLLPRSPSPPPSPCSPSAASAWPAGDGGGSGPRRRCDCG